MALPSLALLAGGVGARAFVAFRAMALWRGVQAAGRARVNLPIVGQRPVWQVVAGGFIAGDVISWMYNSLFGSDSPDEQQAQWAQEIMEMMDEGLNIGAIMMPGERGLQDRDQFPKYFVINLENGQAWLSWEYFSRKFINARRRADRTKAFRGRGGWGRTARVRR